MEDCSKAISINKGYTKAYYRRAMCHSGLNKFREAFDDLLVVLNDSPDSQEVADELNKLKQAWKNFISALEYNKIESQVEEEILNAKKPENRTKLLNKHDTGFKKIKIIEEIIEDPDVSKKEIGKLTI
jgi:DNA-directed RNA polymerase specialized sigma subunit